MAAVRSRVARMRRDRNQRREVGIVLEGTHRPVRVLGIPARDGGIVGGDAHEGVYPRGTGRISVETVLEDLLIGGEDPVRGRALRRRLPIERRGTGGEGASEVDDLGELRCLLWGAEGRRRSGP